MDPIERGEPRAVDEGKLRQVDNQHVRGGPKPGGNLKQVRRCGDIELALNVEQNRIPEPPGGDLETSPEFGAVRLGRSRPASSAAALAVAAARFQPRAPAWARLHGEATPYRSLPETAGQPATVRSAVRPSVGIVS